MILNPTNVVEMRGTIDKLKTMLISVWSDLKSQIGSAVASSPTHTLHTDHNRKVQRLFVICFLNSDALGLELSLLFYDEIDMCPTEPYIIINKTRIITI